MAIERLPLKELREKCREIFYDYAVNGKKFCQAHGTVMLGDMVDIGEGVTPMDMLWQETQYTIQENAERIKTIEEELTKGNHEVIDQIHKEQLEPLYVERELFLNSNMKTQKEFYKKTGCVEYSRSLIKIPLDKLINSYYDDLFLEVLFYDDIAVNAGQYETYKSIDDKEAKKNFVKKNTEITHMGLLVTAGGDQARSIIFLEGNGAKESPNGSIELLSSKYADFSKLTLADTQKVKNNDLRQILQSKIDLDKENLKVLADKDVRGDNYKILVHNIKEYEEYYIRYVCPSTGRVYYNILNLTNLRYSDYYKDGDYESYINAWWSLNNLGASVEGEAITRC